MIEDYEPIMSENDYENSERARLNINANQRVRNVMLTGEVNTINTEWGVYHLFAVDSVVDDLKFTLSIRTPTDEKASVFHKQFCKQFCKSVTDEYVVMKEEMIGKPIWIGKAAFPDKKYISLNWGAEDIEVKKKLEISNKSVVKESPVSDANEFNDIPSKARDEACKMILEGKSTIEASVYLINTYRVPRTLAFNYIKSIE